jgi:uncharacterized protein DUF4012
MSRAAASAGPGAPSPDGAADLLQGFRPDDGSARGRRRPRTLHRVLLALLLLLVAAVAVLAWVGVDAVRARNELTAAAAQVTTLRGQVEQGDRRAAAATLTSLQAHASAARAGTHGPQWSVVRAVPWLGPNIAAVQTVSEVVDGLAVNALPTLMDATALVDPTTLVLDDGRVDVQSLAKAAPAVVAADGEVQDAVRTLEAIRPDELLPAVAAPLEDLRGQVATVALTTATAARAVQLLPPMLGADGPRRYLMLVQNNAEQRATGGVSTLIVLRAVDGRVTVTQTRSAGGNLADLPRPILPLTGAEQALFGTGLGIFMADVTFTPDFPRSGQLAAAIWKQQVGEDLDGVLSIDPGALADVLGATGPVRLRSGQVLSSRNAEQLLMNTVYLKILDPTQQDEFFAATAATVFTTMLAGQGKPGPVVDALARSAREGRLMVWSAHPNEQALLAGTVLSGELSGVDGDSPVIGVYLNDGTAAKIGYYLRTDVVATPTACHPDGSQSVNVRVTMTNTAPRNAAKLPPYISSGNVIPKGQVRMNVLLYAPTKGRVDDVRVNSGAPGVFSQTHNGLAVVGRTVQLKPGQTQVIDYDVLSGPAQTGAPKLRVTPTTFGSSRLVSSSHCE